MGKQIVQVGMCPILNWPDDYNWGETEKHKTHGGHWENISGLGGVGDEIAMRLFFQPYTLYRSIKEKYPEFYFKHYSVLHPRQYDKCEYFNPNTVLSLYYHNPYIDEICGVDPFAIRKEEYYLNGFKEEMKYDDVAEIQWFLKCVKNHMKELQKENNEIPLYDIVSSEDFEEDKPHLYLGEENEKWAENELKDLPKPIIGIQTNNTAYSIIPYLPLLSKRIKEEMGECSIICVGTHDIPHRWLDNGIISYSGKTHLLQGISLIDKFNVFSSFFSGLMYASFIRETPTIVWADEEKGDSCLGLVSWYSKNLPIDSNKNEFIISNEIQIEKVVSNIKKFLE